MNIRFLETFIWLARLQNFRLTAEKLHTTQAAVSSRIASLEETFGVRLFDRNSRSATLTPAGRKMLAYAERIVRLGDEMRREVEDASGDAGLIRIGVIESIVHSWFPALMARVRERFPHLEVEVTSDTTIHLVQLLRADAVDLILQTDPLPERDFVNHPLCEFPMRWVASPSLGLAGTRVDLAQLAALPILSFSRHSGPHTALERAFARAVERPVRINCISSVAAMIRLVSDGFGVAALPPAIIQRELHEHTLEVLDVESAFAPLPLVASYRLQSHPLPARIAELATEQARAFVAALGPELEGLSAREAGDAARGAAKSMKSTKSTSATKSAKGVEGARTTKAAGNRKR
ncbi:LysR family transcriptional regulator [Paraburkholderia silviterrae]|uniref:LysR family transcriptional regulator n=1 Tax=Paraburkholderia silviterrae TaxID=2528715 RepID=A0A4R5M1U4_9BURK|nr:LysR family transcriptional regulator [Paraburkholderia silviterrae]TDG19358.1 LysR family transcriptional regulator [Paraburkholderia silviterrae]